MPLQAPARAPAAAPHTAVPGPLPVRTSAPGPHGPAPADIGDSGTRLALSFSPTGPRPARFVYSRPPCGKGVYFIHVRCHVAASLFCEGAGTVAPASPFFSQSGLQVAQPEALGSNYARARSLPVSAAQHRTTVTILAGSSFPFLSRAAAFTGRPDLGSRGRYATKLKPERLPEQKRARIHWQVRSGQAGAATGTGI